MGGIPVAEQLFGVVNRWGKLPITLYPNNYTDLMPIEDMSMVPNASNPGRTYKYYAGPVLYPFGYGLSYTTFSLAGSCNTSAATFVTGTPLLLSVGHLHATNAPKDPVVSCSVQVTNTGSRAGDEVVIVFTGPNATTVAEARSLYGLPDNDPLAIKQVVDFARVTLAAGASTTLYFNLALRSFVQVDSSGQLVIYKGPHAVRIGRGVGNHDDVIVPLIVSETVTLRGAIDFSL